VSVTLFATASSTRAVENTNLAPAGAEIGTNLVYAKVGERELHVNLVLPKKKPTNSLPVIVWIHGGGFKIGDYTRNRAAWFAEHGYAAASVQYRFTGVAPLPAQVFDCKAAIRFLRANASKYGLDPNHIGVWGGSAGGHLAALIGTSADIKELEGDLGNADQSSRVQAVSPWYGLYDMTAGDKDRKKDTKKLEPFIDFLGGTFAEKRDLAKLVSAVTHATKDDPPFLIVHGEIDRTMPIHQAELLNDALSKAGADVTFIRVKGGNHNLTATDMEPNMDEIERRMLQFFDKHLKQPSGGKSR
jgi:acetyl esterase/lipase